MIYLIFSILSSVLVAVVIRRNEARRLDRLGVMLFNYLAALVVGTILNGVSGEMGLNLRLLPIALATATIFVSAFIVYMVAIQRLGIAIPVTVTRLSVVIPVLGSLLLYAERLSPHQYLGLLLALVAIYLFSWQSEAKRNRRWSNTRTGFVIPLLLFVLMGSGDMSLKVFQEQFGSQWMMPYMLLVFFLSGVLTAVLVVWRRVPLNRAVAVGGMLLGLANFASAYFILKVLQHLPGALAFPLNNIGIILLSTLVGYLWWEEKITLRVGSAIVLAVIAVLLLTLNA